VAVDAPEEDMPDADDHDPTTFSLLVAPGVTVDKWSRVWSERLPAVRLRLLPIEAESAPITELLATRADAGLVRLPVDQDTCHAIPLYTEVTVVVVPRDHLIAAAEEVTIADLADELLLQALDDTLDWTGVSIAPATMIADRPATTAAAVELVAASVGVLVVPQSLARLHHRRDLTYRVLTDAPTSSVALAWSRDRQTDLVEEMIGIVRGRTANSSRGPSQPAAEVKTPRRAPAAKQPGARKGGAPPRKPPSRRGR
jgi:DNA-binding transcriptional LysR family regulator